MNRSRRLALAALLLAVLPLAAQDSEGRASHKPVGTGLDQEASPEEALAARLRGSRDLKDRLDGDALGKSVENLARDLLRDPKFLDSIKDKLSPDQIQRIKERFKDGAGLRDNPALQKLLKDGVADKLLTDKQKDALRQWTQRNPDPVGPDPRIGPQPPVEPAPTPLPQPMPIPPLPTPAKKIDNVPEWMKARLERWTREAESWATGPGGQGLRDFVARLAANRQGGSDFVSGLARRASGLGQYLPRVSGWMPRNLAGNLPSVRMPQMSGGLPSPRSAAEAGKGILVVGVLVLLVFLLWRGAGWYQAYRERLASEWRLGPWPVEPGAVRTREQLVQAFEHLALLLFGRPARTMNHEEIARVMATDPARADDARDLAASYEQARYAPPQDELSDDRLAAARRQLASLAGGSAA